MPDDNIVRHCRRIIDAMAESRLVPFLGSGVNLCGRPQGQKWEPRQNSFLPNGSELSTYLAKDFGYPSSDMNDLVRVSQYIAVMEGSGPLYDELHKVFNADYPPTPLHNFLAKAPSILRDKGYPNRYQLIVTTNYDDVLERAFTATGETYDIVSYIADGEYRGKFRHKFLDGKVVLIEKPNEYGELSLDKRTVILKIHGAIDRLDSDQDSFVITEDHYIDYLTHTDISNLVPVTLAAKLRKSHFLFLGYSLRDWNLRVILHRIWGEQKLSYKSWAIQRNPDSIEQKFWGKRDVDILSISLEDYVTVLNDQMQLYPNFGDSP